MPALLFSQSPVSKFKSEQAAQKEQKERDMSLIISVRQGGNIPVLYDQCALESAIETCEQLIGDFIANQEESPWLQ